MVDPPKATKGRRMSRKSRKKTSKSSSSRKSQPRSPAAAKPTANKTRRPAARKSAKKVSSGSSHKAATKPLRSEGAKPKMADSPALVEGARAPTFHLPRDDGSTVSLSDFSGKKLVLFFYPKANTPGCTKEAIDFTRLANAFADAQTAVLGVSADPLKAQESFRNKHQLSTPLASDEQHEMLEAYGAWGEKSMYGKTFHGVLRTTILIGDDGRIIRLWRNVKVDGHADEVLAAARAA
jgi:peroxiredoxin Q/BCP